MSGNESESTAIESLQADPFDSASASELGRRSYTTPDSYTKRRPSSPVIRRKAQTLPPTKLFCDQPTDNTQNLSNHSIITIKKALEEDFADYQTTLAAQFKALAKNAKKKHKKRYDGIATGILNITLANLNQDSTLQSIDVASASSKKIEKIAEEDILNAFVATVNEHRKIMRNLVPITTELELLQPRLPIIQPVPQPENDDSLHVINAKLALLEKDIVNLRETLTSVEAHPKKAVPAISSPKPLGWFSNLLASAEITWFGYGYQQKVAFDARCAVITAQETLQDKNYSDKTHTAKSALSTFLTDTLGKLSMRQDTVVQKLRENKEAREREEAKKRAQQKSQNCHFPTGSSSPTLMHQHTAHETIRPTAENVTMVLNLGRSIALQAIMHDGFYVSGTAASLCNETLNILGLTDREAHPSFVNKKLPDNLAKMCHAIAQIPSKDDAEKIMQCAKKIFNILTLALKDPSGSRTKTTQILYEGWKSKLDAIFLTEPSRNLQLHH